VRFVAAHSYWDGGTVSFVLVDAQGETFRGGFDGRIQFEDSPPRRCYVGNDHPTEAGSRFLQLWGPEERELVELLTTVISDTLSADELKSLRSSSDLSPADYELRRLAGTVEHRRLKLEAIDQGFLVSPDETCRYFKATSPLHAERLVVDGDGATKRFVITIRDAQEKEFCASFPASLDSIMSPSSFTNWGSRAGVGQRKDRLLMTLVLMALDADPRYEVAQGTARTPQYQQDRASLLGLLRIRRTRILEADAKL
jgi:hypothetical protein